MNTNWILAGLYWNNEDKEESFNLGHNNKNASSTTTGIHCNNSQSCFISSPKVSSLPRILDGFYSSLSLLPSQRKARQMLLLARKK